MTLTPRPQPGPNSAAPPAMTLTPRPGEHRLGDVGDDDRGQPAQRRVQGGQRHLGGAAGGGPGAGAGSVVRATVSPQGQSSECAPGLGSGPVVSAQGPGGRGGAGRRVTRPIAASCMGQPKTVCRTVAPLKTETDSLVKT